MDRYAQNRLFFLILLSICLTESFSTQAIVRYVKTAPTGTGSGNSWANASGDLQGMINVSAPGDSVWVRAGTYLPTRDSKGNAFPSDTRTKTFLIRSDIKVFGSFAGTETTPAARVNVWTTVLSGNLGSSADPTDNSYRVVSFDSQSSGNLLDNISIRYGNDNQSAIPTAGGIYFADEAASYSPLKSPEINHCEIAFNQNGGLYVGQYGIPVLTNCTFDFNSGGADRNQSFSQPTFSDCSFFNNTTASEGGAVNSLRSSPIFTRCKFLYNSTQNTNFAIYSTGGAMYDRGGTVLLKNCLFDGNTALYAGGAISCVAVSGISRLTAINCTFVHNQAPTGAAINHAAPGSLSADFTMTSCIVWANTGTSNIPVISAIVTPTITYSDMQDCSAITGCTGGDGNISVDPQFDTNVAYPYQLLPSSPLINAGDPFADFITPYQTDLYELLRIIGGLIDMGCTEQQMTDGIFSLNDGSWNDPATWGCACIPGPNDVVQIRTAVTVPAGYTATARTILYSGSGRLTAGSDMRLRLGVRARYVKPVPTGSADGTSWGNASGDLRATLAAAQPGEEVWVASGLYKPTTTTDRTLSFTVPSGVKVYGGFDGTETTLNQRNSHLTFPVSTTLSGDIGTTAIVDNTYHVVRFQNAAVGTLLDGFVVTRGGTETNTESPMPPGGFTGGGIYSESTAGQSSSPTIQNCHVTYNRGAFRGGGMYNTGTGTVTLRNCLFDSNYGENGGAVGNSYTGSFSTSISSISLIVTNCNLVYNSCLQEGKAIDGGHIYITNTIVWGNGSGPRPTVFGNYSDPSSISYSIVQDGSGSAIYIAGTVSNTNPGFVANSDYHLRSNSPAINAGDPASSQYNTVGFLDLEGNYRIVLGQVDMGCFEFSSYSY
jgi:predicted outer membrane repeat protein